MKTTDRRRRTGYTGTINLEANPDNLSRSSASLRSDHDALDSVITMEWTE